MDELYACTECGFTTTVFSEFQGHIEKHETEHKSTNLSMSTEQGQWAQSSKSSTPSPRSTPPTDPTPSPSENSSNHPTNVTITEITNTLKKENGSKQQKTLHVCPHCNFTTCMSQHMKSHLEAHERHQGQMYQCDICKMQFSQKANMHRHRMRHSGVKPYECRFCQKRFFRKDQMQEHSMTHIKTGFGFDCPVAQCTMTFSQHNSLRSHLEENHIINTTTPAPCKRCTLLFANSRRLLLHYQTRHDDSDASSYTVKSTTSKKKKSVQNNNDSCSNFDAPTINFEQIQKLMKSEMSPQNTDSSDNSTTPDFDNTKYEHNNMVISSQELLMLCLSNASKFQEINESFSSSAPNVRNNPFQQLSLLVKPENSCLWSDQTPSSIDISSQSPVEKSQSPNSHRKEESGTSEKEDAIDCKFCGMVFFDNTMYLLHKSLHSEDDPFRCALCGTQCGEKYMFTTHIIFADHNYNISKQLSSS